MAINASKIGIQKFVYKAGAGDVTFEGEDVLIEESDAAALTTTLKVNTAKGTERKQGNKVNALIFKETGSTSSANAAAVETDDGNLNNFEIWQLGSSSADVTWANINLIVEEEAVTLDPEGNPSGFKFSARSVVAA